MEDLINLIGEADKCKFLKTCEMEIFQGCLTKAHYFCNLYVYYRDEAEERREKNGYN